MEILVFDIYHPGIVSSAAMYGREENNNICTKLYRAYTIEFLTQFNELFFSIPFPIILGIEI